MKRHSRWNRHLSTIPTWLVVVLLGLPLTHAPTVDFAFRWRLSEIVAWLFGPMLLLRSWYFRSLQMKLFAYGLLAYVLYTGALGLVMSNFVPIRVIAALEGTISPFFRTVLESARFIAGIVVVKAIYEYCHNDYSKLKSVVVVIVASGMMLSLYAFYEVAVLYLGVPLPLAPGSRSLPGFPVAATMYEASAAGSFAAAVALLSCGLLVGEGGGMRVFALIGLALGILGVVLTTSRTGLASLAVGSIVFLLTYSVKFKKYWTQVVMLLVTGAVVVWGVIALAERWLGSLFFARFSHYSVSYYLQIRQTEIYASVLPDLSEWPLGLGQGLWLYLIGGGASLARLIMEGGLIGVIFLAMMCFGLLSAIFRLIFLFETVRPISIGIVAAAIGTLVGLYNYVNLTDIWIWVVLALPVVASEGERKMLH